MSETEKDDSRGTKGGQGLLADLLVELEHGPRYELSIFVFVHEGSPVDRESVTIYLFPQLVGQVKKSSAERSGLPTCVLEMLLSW